MMAGTPVVPPLLCPLSIKRNERDFEPLWIPLIETVLAVLLRFLVSRRMRFRETGAPLAPLTAVAAIVITLRSV